MDISFIKILAMFSLTGLTKNLKALHRYLSLYKEPGVVGLDPIISVAFVLVNGLRVNNYRIAGYIDVYIYREKMLTILKDTLVFIDTHEPAKFFSKEILHKKYEKPLLS